MDIQAITYSGRTVAAATSTRFFLSAGLAERPAGDPEKTFVIYMCAYAREALTASPSRVYTNEDARRWARKCLIPAELAERGVRDVQRTAAALGVPGVELRVAIREATIN